MSYDKLAIKMAEKLTLERATTFNEVQGSDCQKAWLFSFFVQNFLVKASLVGKLYQKQFSLPDAIKQTKI